MNTSEATIIAVRNIINNYKYDSKFMEGIINSFNIKDDAPFNMSGKLKFIKRMVEKLRKEERLDKIEEDMYDKCVNEYYNYYIYTLKNNSRFSSILENNTENVITLSKKY